MLSTTTSQPEQSDQSGQSPTEQSPAVPIANSLDLSLRHYQAALATLQAETPPKSQTILTVLLARDRLQTALSETQDLSAETALQIAQQDEQLKQYGNKIAASVELSAWHSLFNPPSHHWWWFFEPPAPKDAWDQLDWLFNIGSILCLTGFVSFMSQVIPLIFAGGVGLFESIGLMGPGGMLALTLSSLSGGEGRSKIQEVLTTLGIPKRFQSEATFALALTLFLGSYAAKTYLPAHYFVTNLKEGEAQYKSGYLREAKEAFEAALAIPEQPVKDIAKIYTSLGLIEESVGHNGKAREFYLKALDSGDDAVLNNLGRIFIVTGDLNTAETFLRMGLQRAKPDDVNLQYQLHRNLGWAYLEQKRYEDAISELNQAVEFDKQIPDGNLGKGMANCFKAETYGILAKNSKPEQAAEYSAKSEKQWSFCLQYGVPETLAEYRKVIQINPDVARELNTHGIFR